MAHEVSPQVCCSSLASMIAALVKLLCLNPCRTSCNTMELWSRLLKIDMQTFQMVSTNLITLYSPLTFVIRNMVVHFKASKIYPFQNSTCMILTTLSHVLVSKSFSLVAACNHALTCSSFIPYGTPALTDRSFLTAVAISSTSRGPFSILTGCTKIGMLSPSGGCYL